MGKTGKWWRSLFGGKKEPKQLTSATSVKENVPEESKKLPKEKRRWSFRRSVKDSAHEAAAAAFQASTEQRLSSIELYIPETEAEQSKHAIAVAAATAAAADAAVAAAQAAAVVVRLTTTGCSLDYRSISPATQERAAIRIQTAFRRYLAMKALRALKGLVKLQALVRGHMVRKQAAATLRCMQALVKVQARVRARRVGSSEEGQSLQKQLLQRRQKERGIVRRPAKSSSTEMERRLDETAKIVEMDTGRPNPSPSKRNSHHMREDYHRASDRNTATATATSRSTFSFPGSYPQYISSVQPPFQRTTTTTTTTRSPPQIEGNAPSPVLISPAQSESVTAPAGISPRTFSGQFGHFEDTFSTAESSPQYYSATSKAADFQKGPFTLSRPEYLESFLRDYSSFPNYMANTESSKAKARSQSAPKQRPDYAERFSSLSAKKRAAAIAGASMETRSASGSVRMQRSSSHVGMGHHAQLSRSVASLNDPAANCTFGAHKTNFYEYCSSGR